MNNLKRILSLALASVMVMGMMVVGASAADFKDDEDITHGAAVDVMAALEIIGGYDDKTFRPNGDVTRAQMAKMITIAVNGKDPKLGKPTTLTFTDYPGGSSYWAVEYVEYCANLGIIGGKGNGIFDPEGKVTAAEAAKMMLVALGFDADVFMLVGTNWSKNTMTLAQNMRVGTSATNAKTLNLFGGLGNIGANTPLTRDQAAQLIYNGIQANTVQMALTGVTGGSLEDILGAISGNSPKYDLSVNGKSLLESKFGATVIEGVMTEAEITPASSSAPLAAEYAVTYTTGSGDDAQTVNSKFDTDTDVSDLLMQNVRVIYTGKGNNKNVLVITSASDDVLSSGAWGGLDMTENAEETIVRLDGYSVKGDDASALDVYNMETLEKVTGKNITNWDAFCDEYKLIDNNDDGVVDAVLVTPVTLATVKAMNTKTMTLAKVGGGSASVTLATDNVEAGLAKGDYVILTKNAAGIQTVKKAETLTATVDASRATSATTTLRVEGKWYTVEPSFATEAIALNGSECNLVLVAGFIVAGAPVEEGIEFSDAVMVVKVANESTKIPATVDVAATHYVQIRILKADGNTAVINVSGKYTDAYNGDGTTGVTRIPSDMNDSATASYIQAGNICTYIEDPKSEGYYLVKGYTGEGEYSVYMDTITKINKGLAEGTVTTVTTVDGEDVGAETAGSFRFANEANVFVLAGTKYAVVKGSEVNKWAKGTTGYTAKPGSLLLAATSANGFTYVQQGFLNLNETAIPGQSTASSTGYGIVTANAIRVWDTNKYVLSLTIWNGEENIEVKTTEAKTNPDTKSFTAGTVVTYTDNNNGTVSGLTGLTSVNAVTAWDDTDTLKFAKTPRGYNGTEDEFIITDNTVIIYVDKANKTGVASGVISLANEHLDDNGDFDGYINNVYVAVAKGDEEGLAYIIVDIGNAIGGGYDNSKNSDDIKAMANGFYTGEEMGPVAQAISAEPIENLLYFVFTTKEAGTDCVLTVKKDGSQVYTETLTAATAGKHYFVMDKRGGMASSPAADLEPGDYVAEITNAGEGTYTLNFTIAPAEGEGGGGDGDPCDHAAATEGDDIYTPGEDTAEGVTHTYECTKCHETVTEDCAPENDGDANCGKCGATLPADGENS